MKLIWALLGFAFVGYSSTGIVIVEPNEEVIVRRFGRALPEPLPAGPHFEWPWGFSTIDRVRVDAARQVTLGTLAPEDDKGLLIDEPDSTTQGRFLTGDQNLVQLSTTIQYSLADSRVYLFRSTDADRLIADCAESLLTELTAQLPVDVILLEAQTSLGPPLRQQLQAILDDRYQLGVSIQNVNIAASPPNEVKDAFDDVSKARSDKEKKINQAKSYADRLAQQTLAEVERRTNEAKAYAERRQAAANSRAQQFREMLAAYQGASNPQSVTFRLYTEMLEEVFARLNKVLIETTPGQEPVDLSIWRETE